MHDRHMCVYIDIHILYVYMSLEKVQSINKCACICGFMYGCIDIWIEKTKINRVLNEICTQLIFAARFMWSYSLGEPNT